MESYTNIHNEIYTIKDIDKILSGVKDAKLSKKRGKTIDKAAYYNIPAAFDIETSSFYEGDEKRAAMYVWQLGINGYVIIGRTWAEFVGVCETIAKTLKTGAERRFVIYVHNLSYEFQFMAKWFNFTNIFSVKQRKPVKCVSDIGIEFRCSYLLTNKSLEKLEDDLEKYKVSKMVGDLDYTLIRNSKTPLSDKELGYCVNDVKVVMSYIAEQIEDGDVNMATIPLTATGYVRKYCKKHCLNGEDSKNYKGLIAHLNLSEDVYKLLKRAYQGGFTHASMLHSGLTCEDVVSMDFASSYPAVLVAEKYPMTSPMKCEITTDNFYELTKRWCLLSDVKIWNLRLKKGVYDCPISSSKCRGLLNPMADNGRVFSADYLETSITEYDFMIYDKFYDFDKVEFFNSYKFYKGYLPKPLVECILTFYRQKVEYKNVPEKKAELRLAKSRLNSIYGMMATEILQDYTNWNVGKWEVEKKDVKDGINDYNTMQTRFLYFPWGVWCSAAARFNVLNGIYNCHEDYLYSDTDSVKIINFERHKDYFEEYNRIEKAKIERACEYHGFDFEMVEPKNLDGIPQPLGIWDFDGHYDEFKTLGAKRYMTRQDSEYKLTASGCTKEVLKSILKQAELYDVSPFEVFDEDLYIPAEESGRKCLSYIDTETSGIITDYLGNKAEYHELSSIHMEAVSYDFSISEDYEQFLEWFFGYKENV